MISLEGVVSRIRYFHGKKEYVLTDGKSDYAFYSDETIPQGAIIALEGDMGVEKIAAKKVSVLDGEKAKKTLDRVRANIASSADLPDSPSLLKDELTEKLWPLLKEAALEVLFAKKLGRSVLLRFHGDADGVCGAFALTGVLPCKAFQQNSAIYSVKDALRDMAMMGQESSPFVLLLDFGSSEGCREALDLLTAGGIDYLVIDHHPYGDSEKNNKKIVNPFSLSENVSKYTAGYLACEVAVACGFDIERARSLARIACSGDKSDILQSGPEDAKKAMVLDFLASHVSFGNNLDFYKKVMEKEELFRSIVLQADESIEEAAQKAIARMKKQEREDGRGLQIVVFSLEGIVKKGEWPPASKITTRVFDKLKDNAPLLCIGQTDRSLIMRLDDNAVAMGLSANGLAEKIKTSMADFVEGGGGHVKAGAIRVRKGFVKEVLNELIREAGGS